MAFEEISAGEGGAVTFMVVAKKNDKKGAQPSDPKRGRPASRAYRMQESVRREDRSKNGWDSENKAGFVSGTLR